MGRRWYSCALTGLAILLALGPADIRATGSQAPAFRIFAAPDHYLDSKGIVTCDTGLQTCPQTGEPTIGVNPKTGAILYQAWLRTAAITLPAVDGGDASWKDVSAPEEGQVSLDAILYTDPRTGRTFVDQLTGACSSMVYTDDDGASWTPSVLPCQTPAGSDHQTIGSGPLVAPIADPIYPDAVYYCSQSIAYASCAVSLDGGLTFGGGSPLYAAPQCFGQHGHLRTGPDGYAYVPNRACSTDPTAAPWCIEITPGTDPHCKRAVVVSGDNGLTWKYHVIPDSSVKSAGNSDPSVAVGAGNTVYFAYDQGDGRAMVAVSHDHGTTWAPSVDVGAQVGVVRSDFPEIIAGDDGRAAYAFLGSAAPGDDQTEFYKGPWYLYVSYTYDGGKTWTTVNATPGDPVQRGCFQVEGGHCSSRNLLDFNDITIDARGRVLAAFTDGCVAACVTDPKNSVRSRVPAVAVQTGGLGLLAQFDSTSSACPNAKSPFGLKIHIWRSL